MELPGLWDPPIYITSNSGSFEFGNSIQNGHLNLGPTFIIILFLFSPFPAFFWVIWTFLVCRLSLSVLTVTVSALLVPTVFSQPAPGTQLGGRNLIPHWSLCPDLSCCRCLNITLSDAGIPETVLRFCAQHPTYFKELEGRTVYDVPHFCWSSSIPVFWVSLWCPVPSVWRISFNSPFRAGLPPTHSLVSLHLRLSSCHLPPEGDVWCV